MERAALAFGPASENLLAHPLRSGLAALAVAIGLATLITLWAVALGLGLGLDFSALGQPVAAGSVVWLLGAVATICLLLSGISVANTLLLSVQQRCNEIGLRLAMGAGRGDILAQFLAESGLLCSLGALLGIPLGLAAIGVVGRILSWHIEVSHLSLLIAAGFAALLAVLFGIWPALQAARLDPVRALRGD